MMPRFFADTSNLSEIQQAADTGLIFGVTTNPSIIAKMNPGLSMKESIQKILSGVPDIPISVQVTVRDPKEMVRQGEEYFSWDPNRIVVKVPMGVMQDGLTSLFAIKRLSQQGIPVNVTSCMTYEQAYAGLAAGGRYLSLFWCRMIDAGLDAAQIVGMTRQAIEKGFGFSGRFKEKEIIAGSLRESKHVIDAMDAGAHICTVPFSQKDGSPLFQKLVEQLISHERTTSTNEEFYKNAESIGKRI